VKNWQKLDKSNLYFVINNIDGLLLATCSSSLVMTKQGSIVGVYIILRVVILALSVSEDLKCQACWRRHKTGKENDPSYDHKKKMKHFRGQVQEAHKFLEKGRYWRCSLKDVQEGQMHATKSTQLRRIYIACKKLCFCSTKRQIQSKWGRKLLWEEKWPVSVKCVSFSVK
jgi:hypothetical protein